MNGCTAVKTPAPHPCPIRQILIPEVQIGENASKEKRKTPKPKPKPITFRCQKKRTHEKHPGNNPPHRRNRPTGNRHPATGQNLSALDGDRPPAVRGILPHPDGKRPAERPADRHRRPGREQRLAQHHPAGGRFPAERRGRRNARLLPSAENDAAGRSLRHPGDPRRLGTRRFERTAAHLGLLHQQLVPDRRLAALPRPADNVGAGLRSRPAASGTSPGKDRCPGDGADTTHRGRYAPHRQPVAELFGVPVQHPAAGRAGTDHLHHHGVQHRHRDQVRRRTAPAGNVARFGFGRPGRGNCCRTRSFSMPWERP